MRLLRGSAALVLSLSSATLGTCVYPTERDDAVRVSLTPIHILFRGADTVATARAWQMVGPGDSLQIANVVFVWSASAPNVATVDPAGRIVGITSGTAIITAAALNFDKRQLAAADTVRVSAPIEVDSIRPTTVRYGEMLTLYGIGADSIFQATLRGAPLIPNLFADSTYATGAQRRRYWVPFPARTDSLAIIGIYNGSGVFGFVRGETTKVVERDLYEPDYTAPQPLDLAAAPPVKRADTAAGSDVNSTASLATGDYYLEVVDFAGTATTYEVCVAVQQLLVSGFCGTGFPAPPAASPGRGPLRVTRRLRPVPLVASP